MKGSKTIVRSGYWQWKLLLFFTHVLYILHKISFDLSENDTIFPLFFSADSEEKSHANYFNEDDDTCLPEKKGSKKWVNQVVSCCKIPLAFYSIFVYIVLY